MAYMTKKLLALHTQLTLTKERAVSRIYHEGAPGRRDVPFAACLAQAPKASVDEYTSAFNALLTFEADLVSRGYAWRGAAGVLYLNRR